VGKRGGDLQSAWHRAWTESLHHPFQDEVEKIVAKRRYEGETTRGNTEGEEKLPALYPQKDDRMTFSFLAGIKNSGRGSSQ